MNVESPVVKQNMKAVSRVEVSMHAQQLDMEDTSLLKYSRARFHSSRSSHPGASVRTHPSHPSAESLQEVNTEQDEVCIRILLER